jgi:UDP:flavonoid glycosyltransferase YjiC (YdhE family)
LSRILLAWEMGSNLGHLSRLLPLGRRLRARGHSVLAVVRDLALAARVLGPADIPFIQAPRMSVPSTISSQPASYADVVRHCGWGDVQQLWGMTQAWVNVLRMFSPDMAVVDHSPTALLAARVTKTSCVAIGTGFELPPLQSPLPCFPGFPGSTPENAARSEAVVLENANNVLGAAHAPRLRSLSDLFQTAGRWLTTFAELDHYGARQTERYVGPIGEVERGKHLEWPGSGGPRVFAYLRPDTPDLPNILRSLAVCDASVLCFGPGIPSNQTDPFIGPGFVVTTSPLELSSLLPDANLCVSYAPAGTVTSTLLHGVPQLLAPAHVEAQLTAHRVALMGAGLTLQGKTDERRVTAALQQLLNVSLFKMRAAAFAAHHKGFDPRDAAENIVEDIESLVPSRKPGAPRNAAGVPMDS